MQNSRRPQRAWWVRRSCRHQFEHRQHGHDGGRGGGCLGDRGDVGGHWDHREQGPLELHQQVIPKNANIRIGWVGDA